MLAFLAMAMGAALAGLAGGDADRIEAGASDDFAEALNLVDEAALDSSSAQ